MAPMMLNVKAQGREAGLLAKRSSGAEDSALLRRLMKENLKYLSLRIQRLHCFTKSIVFHLE